MTNFTTRTQFEPAIRAKLPIDDLVISIFKECQPRILVFTDGLNYNNTDFGLTDFVTTLKNSVIHGMTPIVKTAHVGAASTGADLPGFTFTSSTLSKSKYDVLFLFGVTSSGTLPSTENTVIAQFMDDGGGVFATGDHANLGLKLCGDIPRVKGMRLWAGPSAGGIDRISTNDPGANNAFEFEDQSDAIAQKIYPAYTGNTTSSEPHFLLQHPTKKIIEVLPDHPHESECILPSNLSDTSEWPKDSSNNTVSPEIVALSVSYGGGFPGKQPISAPKSFGAIAAYNGHLANVGRISTDATWHHFININLIASGDGPGLVANPDAYERVSTYFENIAKWLMPKKVRRCLRWPLVVTIKELYPIAEFIPQLSEKAPDITTLLEVGREARNTLARFISSGERASFVEDIYDLRGEGLANQIRELRREPNSLEELIGQKMAPIDLLEQAALGALIQTAATSLPSSGDLEANLKAAGGIDGLDKRTEEVLSSTLKDLAIALRKGQSRFDAILEQC